jgi:hypothetical protein
MYGLNIHHTKSKQTANTGTIMETNLLVADEMVSWLKSIDSSLSARTAGPSSTAF